MTAAHRLTATAAARQIAAGALTSEALVASCLDRIAAREPTVNAWAYLDPDAVLTAARARDAVSPTGPLHGVPVAIKDVIETSDMPTGMGSPIYDGLRTDRDAACVALLRDAGAVILGKTVTTEFAAITPGKTSNPHNPAHSPGGSSSGSAAAVGDFMAPLAIGTQTVGSVIRPASYCGAVGFKPSFGAFELEGVKGQAPSVDTLGAMARSVKDIALISGVLAGSPGAFDFPALGRPPRLGFCKSPHWPGAHDDCVAAMERGCELLRGAGAEIVEIDLPDMFDDVLDAHWLILRYEIARVLAPERRDHFNSLSAALQGLLQAGMEIPFEDWRQALALAAQCRAEIQPVFHGIDALITPAASGEAPEGLNAQSDLLFQRLWTVLHLPCLTLPGLTGINGLPIGLQVVGPHFGEVPLFSVADWIENALPDAEFPA